MANELKDLTFVIYFVNVIVFESDLKTNRLLYSLKLFGHAGLHGLEMNILVKRPLQKRVIKC